MSLGIAVNISARNLRNELLPSRVFELLVAHGVDAPAMCSATTSVSEVVAEGAESNEALDALAELGCDTAQGYALTPALPDDAVATWIEAYEHSRRSPVG